MKKLLAGLAVLLTASFTGCFAVHGFDPRPSRRRRSFGGGADPFSQIFNGAMSVLFHGAA